MALANYQEAQTYLKFLSMTELIFVVEDDPDGGYVARALGESIFTQADTLQELREMIKDAVHCHYPDDANRPKLIRLF